MPSDPANPSHGPLATLYASGALGAAADADLVRRFASGRRPDADDAFAAIVRRHGPAVLGTCRRMLSGAPEADDAFQAVFLVLARRAPTLRRPEALRPWLLGVSIRTARESRRRSAARLRREGTPMNPDAAISATSHDPDPLRDLLPLLDEEIARLPTRYRQPIRLCDLEGSSRRDAASRLGLPEGTLSSRLARGRALLRDRLSRRGVTPDLLASGLARPPILPPEPLISHAVRHSLAFAAGGSSSSTIPAAVASLAHGVLAMISTGRISPVLAIAGVVLLSAGIVQGLMSINDEPTHPPAALHEARSGPPLAASFPNAQKAEEDGPVKARGVVIDEAGRPVVNAEVRLVPHGRWETRGSTDADGAFSIAFAGARIGGVDLLARSPDGTRAGMHRYPADLSTVPGAPPIRVVLKPTRAVEVRAVDGRREPVAGASVEATGGFQVFDESRTGSDGRTILRIPIDARVDWIAAIKAGVGFDYDGFNPIPDNVIKRIDSQVPAGELPASVTLSLGGAKTVRIKSVDGSGRPISGIEFRPALLGKPGRRGSISSVSRSYGATTGADGIAVFDWLPAADRAWQFRHDGDPYVDDILFVDRDDATASLTLIPTSTIRGRVVDEKNRPVAGVLVDATAPTSGNRHGRNLARTQSDGRYRLDVPPGEVYAVGVVGDSFVARARLDVDLRNQQGADGVDFHLEAGTIVRGVVTMGPAGRPAPNQTLLFQEILSTPPANPGEDRGRLDRTPRRQSTVSTDARGAYSVRLGPGTYRIVGPPRVDSSSMTIAGEPEIVRDFRMPRPATGYLSGRVVDAADATRGIAGAKITIITESVHLTPIVGSQLRVATADAEGRFRVERNLDPFDVCALSPDRRLGAIRRGGEEDEAIQIALSPTATGTGRVVDREGKPLARIRIVWGRDVAVGGEGRPLFQFHFSGPGATSDAEGRFTLTGLVVGREYQIGLPVRSPVPTNEIRRIGVARIAKPGPVDLGTFTIEAARAP